MVQITEYNISLKSGLQK